MRAMTLKLQPHVQWKLLPIITVNGQYYRPQLEPEQ